LLPSAAGCGVGVSVAEFAGIADAFSKARREVVSVAAKITKAAATRNSGRKRSTSQVISRQFL
jgi:hypothetical protein